MQSMSSMSGKAKKSASSSVVADAHPGSTNPIPELGSAVAGTILTTVPKPVVVGINKQTTLDPPSTAKKSGSTNAILASNSAVAGAQPGSTDALPRSGSAVATARHAPAGVMSTSGSAVATPRVMPNLIAIAPKPVDLVKVNKETKSDPPPAAKTPGSTNVIQTSSSAGALPGLVASITKPVDLLAENNVMTIDTLSAATDDETKYFGDIESINTFATTCNASLEWINAEAKRLRLIKTMSGRCGKKNDRVGYGLSTTPSRITQCKRTLFKFGLRKNGLFQPSKCSS